MQNLPTHITAQMIADLTGHMPILGNSSQDVSGEIFGFFRFDLSV